MNKIIKNALILAAITLIAGLLLGAAHQVTLEPIQKQQEKEKQESCQNVFPEAASFEEVTMSDAQQAELTAALIGHGFEAQTIDELLLAKDASGATIGLVEIISTTEGYGGGMQFSMGIASDGTTKGISFLSLSETAGLGMRADTDYFKNQFKDKNVKRFHPPPDGAEKAPERGGTAQYPRCGREKGRPLWPGVPGCHRGCRGQPGVRKETASARFASEFRKLANFADAVVFAGQTLSVCSRCSQPAPPKGELYLC